MEQINIFDWFRDTKEINIGDTVRANYGWHLEGIIPINDEIKGTVIGIDNNYFTIEFTKENVKKVTGIYKELVKKVM